MASLLGLWSAPRKLIALVGGISVCATAIHFGVTKPINKNNETLHLLGSQPLMEGHKGNPYESRSDISYLVKDFRRNSDLPSMHHALTFNHMEPETKRNYAHEFSGSVRRYLMNDTPITPKKYELGFLKSAAQLFNYASDWGPASEIDITYKSYLYNRQVRDMDVHHLVQDILWSLTEESSDRKTIIRPNSIDISFRLEKTPDGLTDEIEKYSFPALANKVKDFNIRFKVYNPNNDTRYVFKSISILPYQETEISISIDSAEIRPFRISLDPTQITNSVKWGLVPDVGVKFKVKQVSIHPSTTSQSFMLDRLSLIYGTSRFIKTNFRPQSEIINSPNYQNFFEATEPYLVAITADQIKKDLEMWYGSAFAFQLHLRIKDIKKLVDIMDVSIFRGADGSDRSGLSMLVESSSWRNTLYNGLNLNRNIARVLEGFFDDADEHNTRKISVSELKALFKSTLYQLEQLKKKTQLTLEWKKEPEITAPEYGDDSPFPAVSFELVQEMSWNEKIEFPFKGCWLDSESKYDASKSDQNSCSGGTWFDFSHKLDNLHQLLAPLTNLINPMVMNILPDANAFLGWSKLEIDKDEKITATYSATKSPIRPAIDSVFDSLDDRNVVPGWKALDVKTTYDLSKFHKFFYKLYEKIDTYKDPNSIDITSMVGAFGSVTSLLKPDSFKSKPITLAVHMINQLWDPNYWSSKKSTPEDQRPWPVFFKSLLHNPLIVESTQLFAGYSTNLFDVENWVFENNNLYTEQSNKKTFSLDKEWQSKDINKKDNIGDENWDFPAKAKSKKLEKFLKHYRHYLAFSFPDDPLVFFQSNTSSWKSFLNGEGSTSTGFINNRDRVKSLIQEMAYKKTVGNTIHSFPSKQLVNWDKVKLSFTQLRLEEAIKSVLGLQNNIATAVNSYLKVPFNTALGEFIQRDGMMVTVNMMLDAGSIRIRKEPLIWLNPSAYSTFSFFVYPHFDQTKLHTSLHPHLGIKKKA